MTPATERRRAFGLRATGHTASDQVETVLYRLVSSGNTKAIKVRREDGVVRPLLEIWREETVRYCEEHGLAYRVDSSNADTKRGLIREEILPLLRQLHPGADRNLLALADEQPRLPRALERTLAELLASTDGTKSADLGHGVRAVREYDDVRLEGSVRFGPWRIESTRAGPRRSHAPSRRSPRRAHEEGAGCARGREGAESRARHLADRRLGRRGRGGSRDRRSARLGRCRPGMEGSRGMTQTELEKAVGEVLIEEDAIQARIGELGAEISADYAGRDLLLVGVLKGAVFFMADLMRELTVPVRDRLHGDLELRRGDRLLGSRTDPEGPRHQRLRDATSSWSRTSSTRA